jgi:hypothetical protein
MRTAILIFLAILLANTAYADNKHHNGRTVINNYNTYVTEEIINQSINQAYRSEVRAAAAGQTNYKATDRVQWNIGAAFIGGESALNLGIGYQAGSVFIAGGVTDNTDTMFTKDSDPLVTVNAGGVF